MFKKYYKMRYKNETKDRNDKLIGNGETAKWLVEGGFGETAKWLVEGGFGENN